MNDTLPDYERALLDRAACWPHHGSWRDLTAETLRVVAAREGLDFATALLYDRLVRSPEHGALVHQVPPRTAKPSTSLDATIAIVPGACYVEYPHTGADGRRLRALATRWGVRSKPFPSPAAAPWPPTHAPFARGCGIGPTNRSCSCR